MSQDDTVIRDICVDERNQKWVTMEVERTFPVSGILSEIGASGISVKNKKLAYLDSNDLMTPVRFIIRFS